MAPELVGLMEATNKQFLSQSDVAILMDHFASECGALLGDLHPRVRTTGWQASRVYGVPRGGIPVAMGLASRIHGVMVDSPEIADIIVDDVYDSGATALRYKSKFPDTPFMCLVDKRQKQWSGKWIVMPWEVSESGYDASGDDIVTRLLEYIGEDPTREGLKETPKRVLKAWGEWAQGYKIDPVDVLKTFQDGAERCGDEMVIVTNIPVISKCEHHLADINGLAHVGYIPNGRIVGLSKLARVTDLFARRLQVQERLTNQIADAIEQVLEPKGVGVIVKANHACMASRGVKIQGSLTITSAMRGALLEKPAARAEFLQLCDSAEKSRG